MTRTSINYKAGDSPLIISLGDKAGLVCIENARKTLQVNYSGNGRMYSYRTIENPNYQNLLDAVRAVEESDAMPNTFVREERGLPLVIYDPSTNQLAGIISFGRRFQPGNETNLHVSYIGPFDCLKYEDRKELSGDNPKNSQNELIDLNRWLIARKKEKNRIKKKNRRAA